MKAQSFPNSILPSLRLPPSESGFGMIEVIVSMSIVAILLVSFTTLTIRTKRMSHANANELRATLYLQEVIEVAKDLEQSNWAAFPATCPPPAPQNYHPVIQTATSTNVWALAAGSELLDNTYTRELTVEPVFRAPDASTFPNEIVTAGGVCDENTKRVVGTILWDTRTLTLETYVYNL